MVSKAYLNRFRWLVKDPVKRAAIREFLVTYRNEIKTGKVRIINDELHYTGTIGDVTFYGLHGKYIVRSKTSLDGERFRKDKAFSGSRKSAERFALGNKLASKLYAMVEGEQKQY